MEIWDRILTLSRMLRGNGLRHYELSERLQAALADRADREGRPAEELQAELLRAGLDRLDACDRLRRQWDGLSPRERDVTAYTCLGYTNQQMARKMYVSPYTVKEYMRSAQVKWNVHNKSELRLLMAQWDFSAWGEHPGTP